MIRVKGSVGGFTVYQRMH